MQASIVAVGPPRDRRLSAALAVHGRAKVRTLGWAISVIEGVYADFETLAARIGGLHLVAVQRVDDEAASPSSRLTIPDVTFSYLHNKYGSKALVDEYVGSLVNTLSAWQLVRWLDAAAGLCCMHVTVQSYLGCMRLPAA